MQRRRMGQYNGKWPTCLVCVWKPLKTVISATVIITHTNDSNLVTDQWLFLSVSYCFKDENEYILRLLYKTLLRISFKLLSWMKQRKMFTWDILWRIMKKTFRQVHCEVSVSIKCAVTAYWNRLSLTRLLSQRHLRIQTRWWRVRSM